MRNGFILHELVWTITRITLLSKLTWWMLVSSTKLRTTVLYLLRIARWWIMTSSLEITWWHMHSELHLICGQGVLLPARGRDYLSIHNSHSCLHDGREIVQPLQLRHHIRTSQGIHSKGWGLPWNFKILIASLRMSSQSETVTPRSYIISLPFHSLYAVAPINMDRCECMCQKNSKVVVKSFYIHSSSNAFTPGRARRSCWFT